MHAFRRLYFCHSLNRLQRDLSAIAELLVKIWTDFSFVLSQFTRLTDRRTDGRTDGRRDRQTDRILTARPRLHSMQRGKNVDLNQWTDSEIARVLVTCDDFTISRNSEVVSELFTKATQISHVLTSVKIKRGVGEFGEMSDSIFVTSLAEVKTSDIAYFGRGVARPSGRL